ETGGPQRSLGAEHLEGAMVNPLNLFRDANFRGRRRCNDNVSSTVMRGHRRFSPLSLLAGLALAVGLAGGASTHPLTVARAACALDPRNPPFNAVPNDGEDDREALQAWIDAGCASPSKLLYLPPGDWPA